MAHELEIAGDGSASFAHSSTHGSAWHRLGVEMDGLSDADSILAAARADYTVTRDKLLAVDPTDAKRSIDTGKYFTWRDRVEYSEDGTPEGTSRQCLGVVGSDYRIIQNREATELALELARLAPGEPNIDCAGVMFEGRRFFVTIPLPDLVIDPNGIADSHQRYIVAVTGHDAGQSLEIVNSITRAVCNNTVTRALGASHHKISIRHVGTVDMAISEARSKLGLLLTADEKFEVTMLNMLGIDSKWAEVERIAARIWPLPDGANERTVTNHENRLETLHGIWSSNRAAGGVGENRYAVFQTLTEYMEHNQHIVGKDTSENRAVRAVDSMGFNNRVNSLGRVLQMKSPVKALAAAS